MNDSFSHREDPQDGDLLAAEYVLGVLDADTRQRTEQLIANDATFAFAVEAWQQRLQPLSDEILSVEAPAHLWERIRQSVEATSTRRVVDSGREKPVLLWNSLALWRWLAGASSALAVASVAGWIISTTPTNHAGPMIATLQSTDGHPMLAVTLDPGARTMMIMPVSAMKEAERVPELWLIPDGGQPRSLGVLDPSRPMRINLTVDMAGMAGSKATLAISMERSGGSPGPGPTGPVVAQGKLQSL